MCSHCHIAKYCQFYCLTKRSPIPLMMITVMTIVFILVTHVFELLVWICLPLDHFTCISKWLTLHSICTFGVSYQFHIRQAHLWKQTWLWQPNRKFAATVAMPSWVRFPGNLITDQIYISDAVSDTLDKKHLQT